MFIQITAELRVQFNYVIFFEMAEGPLLLHIYSRCWVMCFESFSRLAPEKVSMVAPLLMKTNVGMLEMLYFNARSSISSTSTYECERRE